MKMFGWSGSKISEFAQAQDPTGMHISLARNYSYLSRK